MRKKCTAAQRAALIDLVTSGQATPLAAATKLGVTESTAYYWPKCAGRRSRYLELAPKYWLATRGRLRPEELAAPISAFAVPPPLGDADATVVTAAAAHQ